MIETPNIKLYSDGGAKPNPGKGGFGVILSYEGKQKESFRGFELTTNNRMELRGVIFGLEQLKIKSNVQVYIDSKYVVDGITKGWAEKWKNNNWKRKGNKKALNSDLWGRLLNLISKHNVEFNWVKGHSGHTENERCDTLASYGINSKELIEDAGYLPEILDNNINIEKEDGSCRKCNTLLIKSPRKKKKKFSLKQTYYFEYTLLCTSCRTRYLTNEARREIIR